MKKLILVNIFIILFILIFFEGAANFFKLSNLMGIERNLIKSKGEDNYFFKSNSSGIVFDKIVFTDEKGFRVPYRGFKYQQEKPSIIFFGDSVTFGNGIKEERTFVGKLRNEFKDINFYNFSLPGYQINHHRNNFLFLKDIKKIKQIYYVYTLNDLDQKSNLKNNQKNKKQINKKNFIDKIKNNLIFNRINYYLRNKSYTYMFIKGTFTDPSKRWFMYDSKLYNKSLESLDNFFEDFKNYSISNNLKLKIIIMPYEFQTRKNNCIKEHLFPQNNVIKILSEKKIEFFDFTSSFCNSVKPKKLFYKFDPMHLSNEGHEIIFNKFKNEIN